MWDLSVSLFLSFFLLPNPSHELRFDQWDIFCLCFLCPFRIFTRISHTTIFLTPRTGSLFLTLTRPERWGLLHLSPLDGTVALILNFCWPLSSLAFLCLSNIYVFLISPIEYSEGLCCSLWWNPKGGHEMGTFRHKVSLTGEFTFFTITLSSSCKYCC